MSDSNENTDDATERARLDQQAFERLPLSVQLATKLKQENSQANQTAYVQRRTDRGKKGALVGAALMLILHLPVLDPIGLVLSVFFGAACGYVLIAKELGQLTGILLFGLGTVAFDGVALAAGLGAPNFPIFLFIWLVMIVSGVILSVWAKKERDKTEVF